MLGFLLASAIWSVRRIKRQVDTVSAAQKRQETIRTTGISGTATVIEVTDTGTRLGNDLYYVLSMTLAVDATDTLPAFQTTISVPVSPVRMPDFAEGKQIAVRIEPETREVVVDQRQR